MKFLCVALASASLAIVPVAPCIASQTEVGSAGPSALETLGQAAAYETVSSLMETVAFVALFGGGFAVAGSVMAINFTTSLGAYFLNEYAWSALGPEGRAEDPNHVYQRAATFRAITLARIYTIGAALGGGGAAAPLFYTVSTNIADTALYVAAENYFRGKKPADVSGPVQLALE